MKCCKKELSNPDVINGTAYFVCPECGNVLEAENYRIYTIEESFSYFEEKYGLILPKEYKKYSGLKKAQVVKLPSGDSASLKYYFGERFYEIKSFASVDPNDENSIYQCVSSGREWGLQDTCIPVEGDGHCWLALDYSGSSKDPKVIIIETDEGNSMLVASDFKEFTSNLLEYEEVFDLDGNVIYKR